MRDIRQTPQYARYLKSIGWIVETKGGVNYFIKKFPLIGSVIKVQRPEILRYKDIKILSDKYRSFQLIVEPKTQLDAKYLVSTGFKLSKSPYLPTKTLQTDLSNSMNRFIESMKRDAKQAIKKTEDLEVEEIKNLEEFVKSWGKAVGWKRHIPSLAELTALKKSFGNNSIFLSEQEGNTGAIFLTGDKIGYYWQAFSSKAGRKNLAQYKIVWEGIRWAKSRGARLFDFEGIYDERFPNKKWLGFTHFKKSFGGYEVEYPGTFVKNRFPL